LSHALLPEESQKSKDSAMQKPTEIKLADIKCFDKLGEGSSGIVHKAIYIPTKTKLALKVFSHAFKYDREYQ